MTIDPRWPQAANYWLLILAAWFGFSVIAGLFKVFNLIEAGSIRLSQAVLRSLPLTGELFVTGALILSAPFLLVVWRKMRYAKN